MIMKKICFQKINQKKRQTRWRGSRTRAPWLRSKNHRAPLGSRATITTQASHMLKTKFLVNYQNDMHMLWYSLKLVT